MRPYLPHESALVVTHAFGQAAALVISHRCFALTAVCEQLGSKGVISAMGVPPKAIIAFCRLLPYSEPTETYVMEIMRLSI